MSKKKLQLSCSRKMFILYNSMHPCASERRKNSNLSDLSAEWSCCVNSAPRSALSAGPSLSGRNIKRFPAALKLCAFCSISEHRHTRKRVFLMVSCGKTGYLSSSDKKQIKPRKKICIWFEEGFRN